MEEKILIELQNNADEMEGFQFVLRAMIPNPGDDNRCHAHCVKITEDSIIGTDSKRCHVYKPIEIYQEGYYRVIKRLKTHVILLKVDESDYKVRFPQIENLFIFDKTDMELPISAEMIDFNYHYVAALTKLIRKMPSAFTLNPDYAKDLNYNFKAYILNDRVVFESETRKACIGFMTSTLGMEDD